MNLQKFRAPVFSRQPGGKPPHDAAWLKTVLDNVRNGLPSAWKRLSVIYKGTAPHIDPGALTAPIEARPSSAETISEPVDVPGTDEMVRKVEGAPEIHPAFRKQMKR
jgi:hypothetical protein